MKLSDLSIKRPVLAVVMSLLLLVLGVMSFMRLTLRELPAIDPPIVSVQVDYPGASASVVETRITQTLEDALAGIEGINTIDSSSQNGASRISIEFLATRDIEAAANDVRNAVSRVADRMPEEADPPEISKVESDSDPIIWLNLRSNSMDQMQLSDYAERYLVDRFSSLAGVAQVRLGGKAVGLAHQFNAGVVQVIQAVGERGKAGRRCIGSSSASGSAGRCRLLGRPRRGCGWFVRRHFHVFNVARPVRVCADP